MSETLQAILHIAITGSAGAYELWFIVSMVKAKGSFMDRFLVPWERTKTMLGSDKLNAWLNARHQRRLAELQQMQERINALKDRHA